MPKAQGGLEYLIIIAAVLAIASVVVLTLSGVLTQQTPVATISACKQAATECKASRMISPNDPCLSCNSACINPTTGKEIFDGAIYCCNHSMPEKIYMDSAGCGGGYSPVLTITSVSPASGTWFNTNSVTLRVTTDMAADCTYMGGLVLIPYPMDTSDGLTHSKSLTLAEGRYTYDFSCKDRSTGKTAEASTSFGVDTTPPTVQIDYPLAGATVSGTLTVRVSASDSLSGLRSISRGLDSSQYFYIFTAFCVAVPDCSFNGDSFGSCSHDWGTTKYANGGHQITASARDMARNTATTSISVTVSNSPLGNCDETAYSCSNPDCCRYCSDGYAYCQPLC